MRPVISLFLTLTVFTLQSVYGQTFDQLIEQADASYDQGKYEVAGRNYERAFKLGSGSAGQYYNAACSWSLAGNADKAFEMLEGAIDRGHHDLDWILSDGDLDPLHGDARWEEIVAKSQEAKTAYLRTINVELYEMFQEDQSDRQGEVDWNRVAPRDRAREKRTLEMIEADLLKDRDDFVHASFIFQHGADSTSFRLAHEMAMKALAIDSTYMRARWIAAASKDRYLQSIGQPQIYGTQLRTVEGRWSLEPIDTTAVTDAERARWGVRSLARQRAWAAELNAR